MEETSPPLMVKTEQNLTEHTDLTHFDSAMSQTAARSLNPPLLGF